jgi:hypothetical protein
MLGLKLQWRGLSPASARGAPDDSPHWGAATWHILSAPWIRFRLPATKKKIGAACLMVVCMSYLGYYILVGRGTSVRYAQLCDNR